MNKKKFVSVGIFSVVIVFGACIAYYYYPLAINNALRTNNAGVDMGAGRDFLSVDGDVSSSSMPVDDGSVATATQADVVTVPSIDGGLNDSAIVATPSLPLSSVASSTLVALPVTPCVFPASAPAPSTTHEIILNEIAWMGSSLSSTAEWMEIKNISATAVDLSGWELLDASGRIKISFTGSDGALAPGGMSLLSRGAIASGAKKIKIYSGDLANTGDTLALMDPQCATSDYLDASGGWPAGNNMTKQTLERDADGVGWHTSAQPGGTPGAENSTAPAAAMSIATTAPAMPVPISISAPAPTMTPVQASPLQNISPIENILEDTSPSSDSNISASTTLTASENNSSSAGNNTLTASVASSHILVASVQISGASSSNDLVGLYNPTIAAIDMSGWKLRKKSSTGGDYSLKVFPAGSVVAAGQLFIWANSNDGFSETADANVSSTETLAANNSVALMDAAGTIVDAVAWGTGTNQYGEGPPYPTSPGANQLLSRRSLDGVMANTDDNSNDFTIQ